MSKADKRKGFVLYFDQIEQVGMLNDEEAGQLFKALFSCNSDQNPPPCFKNPLIQMCFSVIHAQMRRDAEKYEQKCERMAENARKKWEEQAENEDEDALDAIACNTKTKTEKEKNKKTNMDMVTDGVTESGTEKDAAARVPSFILPKNTERSLDDIEQEQEEINRLLQKGVPPTYVTVRIERARAYAGERGRPLSHILLEWWMKDKDTETWRREARDLRSRQKSAVKRAEDAIPDPITMALQRQGDCFPIC